MIHPLNDQQMAVLQAVYDYFREHGTWPTFITIDRPIRRQRHWDTGAIILSLPESLVVPPRQGMRPIITDELRLRLVGIQACDGSADDLERFVRTLRWLAEREETYEPPAGSGDELPQVTSQEVADHLGLDSADLLPLRRLLAMLEASQKGLIGELAQLGDDTSPAATEYRKRIREHHTELYSQGAALHAQLEAITAQAASENDPALIEQLPYAPGFLLQAPTTCAKPCMQR
jgi:hypothetical protein